MELFTVILSFLKLFSNVQENQSPKVVFWEDCIFPLTFQTKGKLCCLCQFINE